MLLYSARTGMRDDTIIARSGLPPARADISCAISGGQTVCYRQERVDTLVRGALPSLLKSDSILAVLS